jgi:hypothetical protein
MSIEFKKYSTKITNIFIHENNQILVCSHWNYSSNEREAIAFAVFDSDGWLIHLREIINTDCQKIEVNIEIIRPDRRKESSVSRSGKCSNACSPVRALLYMRTAGQRAANNGYRVQDNRPPRLPAQSVPILSWSRTVNFFKNYEFCRI